MKKTKKTKARAQTTQNKSIRSKLVLAAKMTFVIGLLYFLVQKGFISVQATQQALQQWHKIIPGITAIFIAAALGVVRWQWLLRAQNIQLDWGRTFQLTFIGNFFNIALPGAVSGDFVKAFYVGKEVKGYRARAFGSILFDRVAGLSALILVSAGALIFGLQDYLHSPLFRAIQVVLGLGASSVILFYGYLFLVQEKHDPVLKVFQWLEKKTSKAEALTRIYLGIRHYHHHRLAVTKVLILSIIIHLAYGWGCLCFAEALGDTHLSLIGLYIVVPLGLLVTAVPVAPAGVGTGNVAFLYLFQLLGSQRGADVFSLAALTNILVGAVGGLIYFRFRSHEPAPVLDTLPA